MFGRLEKLLLALVVSVLIAGASVTIASQPWLTRLLSRQHSVDATSALTEERTLELAEQVRTYVVDGEGALPTTVDGQAGFEPEAVAHLDDVREVLGLVRLITLTGAAAVVLWAVASFRRGTVARFASGLRAGAVIPPLLIVLAVLVALIDFSAFFAWFHSLFFADGTWTFSAESLLIRLFPQGFWEGAGLWVGGLVGVFSVLVWVLAAWLGRASRRGGA